MFYFKINSENSKRVYNTNFYFTIKYRFDLNNLKLLIILKYDRYDIIE